MLSKTFQRPWKQVPQWHRSRWRLLVKHWKSSGALFGAETLVETAAPTAILLVKFCNMVEGVTASVSALIQDGDDGATRGTRGAGMRLS
ncbi:hypothetical protein KC19_VG193500 [Ceratodon purpureus]|uniref:Uncharacterized protein n=1 Tax=Ceratodon purpureus TaxID=3225 RepID=A0A8T0HS64_CERPU|nr:hypothetical protein KC19_VG193500 [Ceratodon purpureus]